MRIEKMISKEKFVTFYLFTEKNQLLQKFTNIVHYFSPHSKEVLEEDIFRSNYLPTYLKDIDKKI